MRNVQGGAKRRKPHRILRPARTTSGGLPKSGQRRAIIIEELGAILKSRAIDEAAWRLALSERVEHGNEIVLGKASLEAAFDQAIAGAEAARVEIIETIGDERPVPGAPRGRRQGPPGGRRDQNRGTRLRRSHGRD